MRATKCQLKFKGDVENYLSKSHNNIELIADRLLTLFNVKTIMGQCHIRKREGVHPADILFLLIIIPLLKLKTVHSFCQYKIEDWAGCGKDTFYRFKCKAYPWRTFLSKIVIKYFYLTDKNKPLRGPQEPEERYFIFDDTGLPKRGNKIQNVSFFHDHTKGRSTLGFCVLNLGLLTDAGFCPLDFAYRFGQKRHPKSPAEIIGDKRSISGQRSHEAKHMKKTELALDMLGRAIKQGHKADYALFDSWFSSPIFISKIRALYNTHAICRIKINNTYYEYNGKKYNVSQLYRLVKPKLEKDAETGLNVGQIVVRLPESGDEVKIAFAKGYKEPETETDPTKGKKKEKESGWTPFLSTDTTLTASEIIKKYSKRWAIEVFHKETKQLLGLGKEQSTDFNAQVFSTTLSYLLYILLTFLKQREEAATIGPLFEKLCDQVASTTYSKRLWAFLKEFLKSVLSSILNTFDIDEDITPYYKIVTQELAANLFPHNRIKLSDN